MSDSQTAMSIAVPPVEFDNVFKIQIRDEIEYVMWHDQLRRFSSHAQRVLHDGTERRTMQVIEMGVRDQYQVNGWKIADLHAGLAQPL